MSNIKQPVGCGELASRINRERCGSFVTTSYGLENATDERGYLNMRGEVLPIMRLRKYFEVNDEPERFENVVVVRYGEHKAGLVVDMLLGEFQTVIRPLGKVFRKTSCIGGFTILGSGEVALILDVPGLMKQVMKAGEGRELATDGARR